MTNLFSILFFTLIAFYSVTQSGNTLLINSLKKQVEVLSGEEMKGRRAGSSGEEKAAMFIVEQLKSSHIPSLTTSYYVPFEFNDISKSSKNQPNDVKISSANNIVGFIDNKRERSLVIGAHYDHLGKGFHINSRSTVENPVHFGADDNASGVASVLHIANQLNQNEIREAFNILVILFSAEEIGLVGSKAWIEQFSDSLSMAGMINLDMVGRMQDREVQIYGLGTSPSWKQFSNNLDTTINWKLDSSGLGPSDHASFYLDSIPAIHFFTGQHQDYHKETDTYDKINYNGMALIVNTLYQGIIQLSTNAPFVFSSTKNNSAKKRPELKVTMGVMPSYTSDGSGLKIDGVIEGKPAHKAKLLKDDKIISIDNREVNDIYDYMEVLADYDKGDKALITIIRNNKTKTLTIQF